MAQITGAPCPIGRRVCPRGCARCWWSSPLPDDESFGLGAVIDELVGSASGVAVLCFTHGEASTLHLDDRDLATVRPSEFRDAARILRVDRARQRQAIAAHASQSTDNPVLLRRLERRAPPVAPRGVRTRGHRVRTGGVGPR